MPKQKGIFTADVMGLRQLQEGKSKTVIIRELLQNALDEPITRVDIEMKYEYGKAKITVTDDSPIGFRDLADSHTLFKDTYKRSDATKRGKYNFGEKQVICLCDYARIVSTTGTVEFFVTDNERETSRKKRDVGSEIYIEVKMTKEEYQECFDYCKEVNPTADVAVCTTFYEPNSDNAKYTSTLQKWIPAKTFTAKLQTEIKVEGSMKTIARETEVLLYEKKNGKTFIYELGIPVCEIDCDYSIDVQQKVPLSSDRDKVDGKYLKNIYAEVLNQTHEEITESTASNSWVRSAIETGKVSKEAVDNVVEERYGDKVVIANPFDKVSIDDAKANGYRLVYSSELSGEELQTIKAHRAISTSSDLFGSTYGVGDHVTPNKTQLKVFALAERISTNFLPFKASSTIVRMKGHNSPLATFAVKGTLITFYDNMIPKDWWETDENGFVKLRMLDLIIHEMCHHFGMHCDRPYLDAITKLGSQVALHSAQNKSFLKL